MKKTKLEDRLYPMKPIKNGVGRFIPYCNYEHHRGIIIKNKHSVCEKRNCHHYLRLYISYRDVKNEDLHKR